MIEKFVDEGLICPDYTIKNVDKGAFKKPVIIECPEKRFFYTDNKSRFETEKQINISQIFPGLVPEVLRYGDRFSLEEFHDLAEINDLEMTRDLAYGLGMLAGDIFSRSGLVHMDPANISVDLDTGVLMYIDVLDLRRSDIYDAIGSHTSTCVGESDIFVTMRYPEQFMNGFAKSGFDRNHLDRIYENIPTYYQNMLYISKLG